MNTLRRIALTIFAFAQLALAANAQPAWIRDSLDLFIHQAMATEHVPGLALAVIQDGKVVLTRTYGVRENETAAPVDANTLFMIGSNSKAYTATLLTSLDEEKKLSLSDPVTKWLPDFKLYDPCVTQMVKVRDLLCHRLGTQTFQGDFTYWSSKLTRNEVVGRMALLQPPYAFRTRFGYCNSAFLTAGEIIPKVLPGATWESQVRDRIFKPLQMSRALALSAELPDAANAARPHAYYDQHLQTLAYPKIDNLAPAGSISLSINDMTHWLLMQMDTGRYAGKQVFPQEVVLKTWDAQTIVSPRSGYAYGLGWFISYPDGHKMLDHTGGVDGFVSASAFLPEERLGVCVLTNTDNNALFLSIRDQLLQVYRSKSGPNHITQGTTRWLEGEKEEAQRLKELRDKVAAQPKLGVEKLRSYAGQFNNPLYGDVEVRLDRGRLTVYLSNHPGSTGSLEYLGDNNFLCTFTNPTFGIHPLQFSVDDKGAVTGLTLKVNDFLEYGTYEFVRK